jgi:tetratricopeptide (TPR) repeat protein
MNNRIQRFLAVLLVSLAAPLLGLLSGVGSGGGLTAAAWAQAAEKVDPFYLKLFEEGKFEFQSGNLPAAIKDFEIAFIGFLDSPARLLECYVYLTVLHNDLKNVDKSKFYFNEIKKLKLQTYLTAISPPAPLMKKFSDLDSLYSRQDSQARIAAGWESPAVDSAPAVSGASGKALEAEIGQLKTAIRKNSQEQAPYFRLSALYLGQKKTRDARRVLEDLIKISPKDGQAHFELGKIFVQERKLPEAAAALRQAALLSPDNYEINYELGKVFYGQKRSAEAKEAFERVKALNPSYKDTAEYLDLIGAAAAKKTAEAQPFLDQARGAKLSKEKIALYKKAMGLDPSNDQISYELSLAYLAGGKSKEAAELLDPLVRKHPQEARFNEALATAYLASKAFDKTLVLVKQAKAALGEKAELNYLMGKALMGKERFQEAAAEFNKILIAYPDYKDADQLLTICLKKMR